MDDGPVLYDRSYGSCDVRVTWLPRPRVILYAMDGYLSAADTRAYLDDLLVVVEEHAPIGLIADPRRMKTLNEQSQREVQTRFWPAIAALGVRRNPAIAPLSFLAASSVIEMVDGAGVYAPKMSVGALELAVFKTFEECLAWIEALGESDAAARHPT